MARNDSYGGIRNLPRRGCSHTAEGECCLLGEMKVDRKIRCIMQGIVKVGFDMAHLDTPGLRDRSHKAVERQRNRMLSRFQVEIRQVPWRRNRLIAFIVQLNTFNDYSKRIKYEEMDGRWSRKNNCIYSSALPTLSSTSISCLARSPGKIAK